MGWRGCCRSSRGSRLRRVSIARNFFRDRRQPLVLVSVMKIPALLPLVAALFCANVSPAQEPEKPAAEVREKMQKAKREIEELRAHGNHDEAQRLEERVRAEMQKQMAKRAQSERHGDAADAGEMPDRMRHIAEAIKHLRAAGLNEPAERIERMAREEQQKSRVGEQPVAREEFQRAMRDTQEQMQRALKDTHEQMAKMARAIEELREQVSKR